MFVLMDIEWIENRIHHICPTQIAAMRVDEQWHCLELFYSRIRPRDNSFHKWKHMAYTGATATDFLYANSLYRVLTELQDWLRDDDIICLWFEDSKNILKSVYNLVLKCKVPQRIVILTSCSDSGNRRKRQTFSARSHGSRSAPPLWPFDTLPRSL